MSKKFDLFFSYKHDSEKEVKELYNKLKENYGDSLSIRIDYEQSVASTDSNELLMEELKNSSIILCFITKEYCESEICRRELSEALKKTHVILMLEHFENIKESIQFQLQLESKLKFYSKKSVHSLCIGNEYEKLIQAIECFIGKTKYPEIQLSINEKDIPKSNLIEECNK
jgi:hypothetical protein